MSGHRCRDAAPERACRVPLRRGTDGTDARGVVATLRAGGTHVGPFPLDYEPSCRSLGTPAR